MLDVVTKRWPPADYIEVFAARQKRLARLRKNKVQLAGAWEYYKNGCEGCIAFITDWAMIFEPRELFDPNAAALVPFIMFDRQVQFVKFVFSLLADGEGGLCEKSRDMGATWLCVWISIWLWLFRDGAAIGWGSQEGNDVDDLGNPSSIFEKIRIGLRNLPDIFLPPGFSHKHHMTFMRIVNPATGATIIGDVGDNIGRGGRTLITIKDESAHYVHPEMIEAALSQNTRIQLDISSVHGTNTLFHRRREGGREWYPGAQIEKGMVRVFVMDWREHPAKTQEWYNTLRGKHEREGTLHILAQEVDRDYSAAVEGVIIPALWVRAAIDSHVALGIAEDGAYGAALDIADEGGDLNALVARRGIVLTHAEEWGGMDTGATARKAIALCRAMGEMTLQYDTGGGWGAAVKAEFNRLTKENEMPPGIFPVPWNAGAEVMNKEKHVVSGDKMSPTNNDYFQNFKAQATWDLRRRFEITYRAMTEDNYTWDTDDIISIPSTLPLRYKIEKELSQPTWTQSSRLKMMVDKKPDGARSPNLFDAIVMAFYPAKAKHAIRIPPGAMLWAHRKMLRRR
jgi:phage terminase large subunit